MLLHVCGHGISTIPNGSYGHLMGKASVWGLCGVQLHIWVDVATLVGRFWPCTYSPGWWVMPPLCVLESTKLSFKKWCVIKTSSKALRRAWMEPYLSLVWYQKPEVGALNLYLFPMKTLFLVWWFLFWKQGQIQSHSQVTSGRFQFCPRVESHWVKLWSSLISF